MFSVFCNFEGTVTATDVTQQLLEAYAHPGWRALEQDRIEGRVGARACLARQTALIRATRAELLTLFYRIEIDPAFVRFTEFCTSQKLPLVVVSDGFDLAVQYILTRHRLGHISFIANSLQQRGYDRWALTTDRAADACRAETRICKCQVLERSTDEIVYIGNGRGDNCVAQLADIVLAKEELADHCVVRRAPHLPIQGFADALLIVHQLCNPPLHSPPVSH